MSLQLSQVGEGVDKATEMFFWNVRIFYFLVFSGNYMHRLSMREMQYNSKEIVFDCDWGQQWGQKEVEL